jgi:hypothetical protein
MNELTEKQLKESYDSYIKETSILEGSFADISSWNAFNKAWYLQQSRIDELIKALERIKIVSKDIQAYLIATEALEKHKKYKEGGE